MEQPAIARGGRWIGADPPRIGAFRSWQNGECATLRGAPDGGGRVTEASEPDRGELDPPHLGALGPVAARARSAALARSVDRRDRPAEPRGHRPGRAAARAVE